MIVLLIIKIQSKLLVRNRFNTFFRHISLERSFFMPKRFMRMNKNKLTLTFVSAKLSSFPVTSFASISYGLSNKNFSHTNVLIEGIETLFMIKIFVHMRMHLFVLQTTTYCLKWIMNIWCFPLITQLSQFQNTLIYAP